MLFKDVIEDNYWFEFFMGFVGELHSERDSGSSKHVLYTHKRITIQYNKDRIIHVNMTQENLKPLEVGKTLDLTYSVKWDSTNISFGHRFDVYLDYPFFEHQSKRTSVLELKYLTVQVRGAIITTFILCYAFTSFISGYVSGGMYSRNGGKGWIKSMVLTASLFPFLCFGIGFLLNTVAIFYGSLAAIPFGTMVVVFVIWAFISLPLALLGTVVGRNWNGAPANPCRVKTIPRPIPEKKWYLTPSVVSIMGGLLPFGSIFIEMYFVFTSFWNYKVYYVYGFMLLVFVILVIVTMCVTIVGTYFLLNAENYHWQWTSFFSAASTAVYVYLYSIYYYHVKTKMSGFFQTSFYFGYTLMFCLGLGILCGAVGFLGSNLFVRRIYRNIKCD
ncbi:hypothetical protein SAY86_000089 [Trapa natans]|uniref:Transmembrane 9 superfamily member n=1 Tax=Trapa natans TaxID=22666 RepID=A0AAN7RL29_TRANT|nr:hypothetical protein SAY86_000089 [Trapa natans]